jgi:hypothetical protein
MPRHAFKFPPEVVQAIRRHVTNAIDAVNPDRYHQEANYTAALVNRLEGTAYNGPHGSVTFQATVFDDRGKGSTESRLGADYAIIATVTDGHRTVRKAILVQVKLGKIEDMSQNSLAALHEQILKMKQLVAAPKVMEVPEAHGARHPQMISGNKILAESTYRAMSLENYFVARVTKTWWGSGLAIEHVARVPAINLPSHTSTTLIRSNE